MRRSQFEEHLKVISNSVSFFEMRVKAALRFSRVRCGRKRCFYAEFLRIRRYKAFFLNMRCFYDSAKILGGVRFRKFMLSLARTCKLKWIDSFPVSI